MKKGRANSDVPFLYDGRNKTSINYIIIIAYENRYLKSLTARVTILMLSFYVWQEARELGHKSRWREGTALQPVLCRHKSR